MTTHQTQAGRKSVILFLFAVLLCAAPPVAQCQDYTYIVTNGVIKITRYTGPGGDVTIPSSLDGLPITVIGSEAFKECTNLSKIRIPDNVTSVGIGAFERCWELSEIWIGKGVTEIGHDAFSGCRKLTQVLIPDNVLSLGSAFPGCTSLTHVVIGNGVSAISGGAYGGCAPQRCPGEDGTFNNCASLISIRLGSGVTNIGVLAFFGCTSLTNIAIPKSVTSIGEGAFGGCSNLAGVFFQGDAPVLLFSPIPPDGGGEPDIFLPGSYLNRSNTNVVVYYLPGTTGWGPTFSYRPSVLWNPQFQTSDLGFGGHTTGFGLPITGSPNIPIVLEASTDLSRQAWVPLLSCTLTNGSLEFRDSQWTAYPTRFYRIRSP